MVRWASGVTTMRLRPVGGPRWRAGWRRARPGPSCRGRRWRRAGRRTPGRVGGPPPKLATPATVLPAEPPDASMPELMAAYSSSARSVCPISIIEPGQPVRDEEVVGFVRDHVDEGVADPDVEAGLSGHPGEASNPAGHGSRHPTPARRPGRGRYRGPTCPTTPPAPRTVRPRRYDLTLTPDLEAATFAGDEVVAVEVVTPTADVVLNAVEIEIDEATARVATAATRSWPPSASTPRPSGPPSTSRPSCRRATPP